MTLTETLQLKERFLKFEDLRALDYCEKRWLEENRPIKRWELFNFIEKMLKELEANGIGYPKVLLLRKKEIQRKTFTPAQQSEEGSAASESCPLCKGQGWRPIHYPNSAPSYTACSCASGSAHRVALRGTAGKVDIRQVLLQRGGGV
ncbi:MAG: hypothetical protein WBG02_06475 [Candidatus Acidiferrum sp.]